MQMDEAKLVTAEKHILPSKLLSREVTLYIYFPKATAFSEMNVLLINDGQDLITMNFNEILSVLYKSQSIKPLFCVGIGCGAERKEEYGTAKFLDYKGRGTKAKAYQRFIFEELFPFIKNKYPNVSFSEKSFCGFSMGGLSALDIVWNYPKEFKNVGVFSGSLWWRLVSQDDTAFDENNDRIMQFQIRNGGFYPWLKFFFETGTSDETADRNKNGVIDSIDDTVAIINELLKKGYSAYSHIRYIELKDGKHDVATWAKAFPEFLKWAFN